MVDVAAPKPETHVPVNLPEEVCFRTSSGKVREHPVLPCAIADSHAHLEMLENPALAVARAMVHGLEFVCCMVDPSESTVAYDMLDRWEAEAKLQLSTWSAGGYTDPHGELLATGFAFACKKVGCGQEMRWIRPFSMRLMAGVHPHNAKAWSPELRATLEGLLDDPRTCGLGEIGLDYHYDLSPREQQRAVFAEQLQMAVERNEVVSLHLREAHGDALAIMDEVGLPEAGCILHCCTLPPDELRPFLERDCYVAYGGALTFANGDAIREAAPLVPLDRLLLETDSPYMAPKPLRGVECGPAHTIYTADLLARIYTAAHPEFTAEQVLAATFDNTLRLLG